MDWSDLLQEGEVLRWEAKPAPRCFTFRNWRRSVMGVLLLLLAVFWEMVGLSAGAFYSLPLLGWIPVPFIFAGLYYSLGHLIVARLEWDRTYYGLTDRRILIQQGLLRNRRMGVALENIRYFEFKPHGEELASVRIAGSEPTRDLHIVCLEHPGRLTHVLEQAILANHPENLFLPRGVHRSNGKTP